MEGMCRIICLASGRCKLQQTRPWLGLVGSSRGAEVTSLEKALLIGCARLWAATGTSGTRGACVVSADQAPRRAGSMCGRGNEIANDVTQNAPAIRV